MKIFEKIAKGPYGPQYNKNHISPNFYLKQKTLNRKKAGFKEKNPQDIFMRPRLVQERVLLEKLRNHADELVSPKSKTPESPTKSTTGISKFAEKIAENGTKNKKKPTSLNSTTTSSETENVPKNNDFGIIKSEPPSPEFEKNLNLLKIFSRKF